MSYSLYAARPIKSLMVNKYVSNISLLSSFPLKRTHPILSSTELVFTLLLLTVLDPDVFNKS